MRAIACATESASLGFVGRSGRERSGRGEMLDRIVVDAGAADRDAHARWRARVRRR